MLETQSCTLSTGPVPSNRPAPVAVFAYMRPLHLQRTIESLQRNPEAGRTDLYIFCDAPKRPEHREKVEAVRRYVEAVSGFASVTTVLRERNLGLARSIIDGVTGQLDRHGRIIVVEDDLVLSPHFLHFMNDGLDRYENDESVASVHGYIYPTREPLPEAFFLKGADCWGWATWSRAWRHFEPDGKRLMQQLAERRLTSAFDLDGSYPFTKMLEAQIAGRNDSWAIRWHASCYLDGMLTLYPGRTLVDNIGNDSSGTHCESTFGWSGDPTNTPIKIRPIPVVESAQARQAVIRFLRQHSSVWNRLKTRLTRALLSAA